MEKSAAITDFFSSLESPPHEHTTESLDGLDWEAPTQEKALEWLASVRPAAILALLREPEFARISAGAFSGFRVNAQGYANPLVRRRLALDATQSEKFSERLRTLAEAQAPGSEPHQAAPVLSEQVASPQSLTEHSEQKSNGIRAEKQRDRRERDAARAHLTSVQQERDTALRQVRQIEQDQRELQRQQEQLTQKLARQERQLNRLHQERTALTSALRQTQSRGKSNAPSPKSFPEAKLAQDAAIVSPWETAVQHLLHKRRYEIARSLADDVLRDHPNEPSALDILAAVAEAEGHPQQAIAPLKQLTLLWAQQGDLNAATESLIRLLILVRSMSEVTDVTRSWLHSLDSAEPASLRSLQAPLIRLRGLARGKHQWLTAQVRAYSPALADELMPQPGALRPDDPLPLELSGHFLTARQLIAAVYIGDVTTVEIAREALARLDSETTVRINAVLEQTAQDDPSALAPLRLSHLRGPVVLDGSNAAWFGQELLAEGRPRLQPILALRRALRQQGFFPVLLYGDAPLPYTIDSPESLKIMMQREEIRLVDSGVDADEILLREAKRLHAPLVTNDQMTDWDRDKDVEKIRFDIAPNGTVSLLFQK